MNNYSVRPELDKFPGLLQKLLFYRDTKTAEDAERFLHPAYEENNDPFKMTGMEKVVKRIYEAIKKNEKVIIFSDYDADGIPGAVILHDFFKKIGFNNFENYIPHRVLEGFGLNEKAVDEFKEKKVRLIITIDCGTADLKEAKRIKKHGIDLMIVDHHLPTIVKGKEKLPETVALLNPKQSACKYPDKDLCASGVTFKLVQGLLKKYGEEWNVKPGWEKWLLDMVAIATISDMVPLLGENRIFARYGLMVLRKSPRLGLQKLFAILKMDQKNITEDDIGFMISPRINAASRMGKPEDAFNMLTAKNEEESDTYAHHLNKINDERKGVVASLVKEIKKHWSEFDPEKKRRVLVAGNPDWKPSLLGLVASSLQDDHNGPVFLWGREEGKTLKGSCRSDGCVDIVEMMRESAHLFDEYGGHSASGGFTVNFEKIDVLADGLEASYEKLSVQKEDREGIIADAVISIDDVNDGLERQLSLLSPFGMGNPKPIFAFKNIEIADVKIFGKKNDHLKVDFKNKKGQKISAIAFFKKPEDFSAKIAVGEKIDLLANIEKSYFGGRVELRLRIVGMF
ncbi:MAG: single-stranded-DNA-specific exonuclease RecJ [Candidatus Paceibacterota bacterium]|jgi:single-stranded-DNA-specific exonuclease